jgi:hypothetical protein
MTIVYIIRTNLELSNVLSVDSLNNGEHQQGLRDHNNTCFKLT